jgi:putative ABC transport system substrate-binding protein
MRICCWSKAREYSHPISRASGRRRDFIIAVAGTTAAFPFVARAEQPDRTRRIGVLMGYAETDPQAQARVKALVDGLQELGWRDGSTARLEIRFGGGDPEGTQRLAKELVELEPDVIVSNTTPVTAALHRETKTIPIVFAIVSDPVGDGFVATLAQPGGNITGFINLEESITGKWLELLKELDPHVRRAAIIYNPATAAGSGSYFLRSFEKAAQSFAITPLMIPVGNDADIEAAISALGREPGGGLVMMSDVFTTVQRTVSCHSEQLC